jgi:hypothetical protein
MIKYKSYNLINKNMRIKIIKLFIVIYIFSIFSPALAVSINPPLAYFTWSMSAEIIWTWSWCQWVWCSLPSSNIFSWSTIINNIDISQTINVLWDDLSTDSWTYIKDNTLPVINLSTWPIWQVYYEKSTWWTWFTNWLTYSITDTNFLNTNYNFYSDWDAFVTSLAWITDPVQIQNLATNECKALDNANINKWTSTSVNLIQSNLISWNHSILFCAKDKAWNYEFNHIYYELNEIFKITDTSWNNEYKNSINFNITDLDSSKYWYYLAYNTWWHVYSENECDYSTNGFSWILLNNTWSNSFSQNFNPIYNYDLINKDINYIICAKTDDNLYKKWITWTFKLDNTLPSLSSSPATQTWLNTDWFSTPKDISFSCSDIWWSQLANCNYNLNWNNVYSSVWDSQLVTLNKVWTNYLTISAFDNAWNISTRNFTYNYDNVAPKYNLVEKENYNADYTQVISKDVTISCIDNESWCNMYNIAWWTKSWNDYTKNFTTNSTSTETVTLKDNVWFTTNVNFTVSWIWGNVPSWYGQTWTNNWFYLKTIAANWVTKCDDDTSSDTNTYLFKTPANWTLINGNEWWIKNNSETWRNWYNAILVWSEFQYNAQHRQVWWVDINGNWIPDTWDQLKCQYRDSTKPTFTTEKRIIKATDTYTYYFKDLIDNWWSSNKKLDLTFTEENWTTYSTWIDNSSTSTWVSLWDYLKIIWPWTYDLNNDWVREIKVDMKSTDWAQNTSTWTTTLLVIANDIDYTKSILSKSTKWDYSSTVAVADWWWDYFKYNSTILDKYGNIVRPVNYSWIDLRRVKINDISFNNTVNFLSWWTDKPIYYKWPANNSNNMDATYGQTNYNIFSSNYYTRANRTDWKYDFQVASLVPTKEANYNYNWNNFGIWDINLNNFVFTENFWDLWWTWNKATNWDTWSDKNSSNLATKANSNLSFWPALEIALNPQVSLFTDNTNYDFELQIKNNSKVSAWSFSNLNMNFIYSNTWWLLKRLTYKSWSTLNTFDEQYDNDWLISSKLPKTYSITIPANSSKNETFIINWDSNSFWFGNIWFQSYLSYLNTSIGWLKTSYRTGIKWIDGKLADVVLATDQTTQAVAYTWSKVDWLARKLDINWLIAWKNNSWNDMVTWKKSWSISNKDTNSIDSAWLNKFDFRTDIRKNVELFTNWVTWKTDRTLDLSSPSLTLWNWEKIYYFDYTNTDCSSDTKLNWNNWCLLNINWNENETWISTEKLQISWKNTIIVKWWNINLTSDLYYANNNSLLGIVILRNDNDKTKWWNIYIHPDVTNTIWSLYAEWSILSANISSPKLYDNTNTNDNELRKQLLWFGSLYSANTIWWLANYNQSSSLRACPYNTDIYMQHWWVTASQCTYAEASKYDLANLRRFTVIPDIYWNPTWCSGTWDYPMSSGTWWLTYAWAWKKKCYKNNTVETWLRWTDREWSVVVEYNSNIQNIWLSVFSKN